MRPWVAKVENLNFTTLSAYVNLHGYHVDQSRFDDEGWSLVDIKTLDTLEKLKNNSINLESYADGKIFRGIITGFNKAFVIDEKTKNQLIFEDPKSLELIRPFAIGRDVKRYQPIENQQYLIFIPKGWTNTKTTKNAWNWFSAEYPAIAAYLLPFEEKAKKRWDQGDYWWELRACNYYDEFEVEKIIYPNICKQPEFTMDQEGFFANQKCYIIPINDKYLLGILNSKIMMFYFSTTMPKLRGDFFEPGYEFMKDFPIHFSDPSIAHDQKKKENIMSLVGRMLELFTQNPQTPYEQELLQREIDATDAQIDRLVYDLYGLTEEEIKIVEGEG
jgi:hypothetical protein